MAEDSTKNTKKQNAAFIAAAAVCFIASAAVEVLTDPGYALEAALKIALFVLVPAGVTFFTHGRDGFGAAVRKIFTFSRKTAAEALFLGVTLFGIILGTYYLFGAMFDFAGAREAAGVNDIVTAALMFLFAAAVRIPAEELFFRAFVFLNLRRLAGARTAHIVSALMYALYRFAFAVTALGMPSAAVFAALMLAEGLFYGFIDAKNECIFSSWAVRAFIELSALLILVTLPPV